MDVRDGLLDTRVRDIVHSKSALLESGGAVLTTEPSATVFDCIGRMVDRDIGSIVVVAGEEIAGIFTERHDMRSIALKGRSSKETEVREVMSSDVTTVQPDRNLEECLHLMTELRCRHLPVVGDNDELVGLVSIGDCVKRILDTAHQEIDRLRRYTDRSYPT